MSPRPRQKILDNLEAIYREAYERARAAADQPRMADLDAAYQREQLLLEVLLDVRDLVGALPVMTPPPAPSGGGSDAVSALETIHRIAKLR
jgi:hypothetical protein